jgi:hypothetical protein
VSAIATNKEDVEGPLSLSTFSSRNNDDSVAATAESPQSLPYAQYVKLSPEEMKFNCQVRVMAREVTFPMVTIIINSWEQDLKAIPRWETICGELLFRK